MLSFDLRAVSAHPLNTLSVFLCRLYAVVMIQRLVVAEYGSSGLLALGGVLNALAIAGGVFSMGTSQSVPSLHSQRLINAQYSYVLLTLPALILGLIALSSWVLTSNIILLYLCGGVAFAIYSSQQTLLTAKQNLGLSYPVYYHF